MKLENKIVITLVLISFVNAITGKLSEPFAGTKTYFLIILPISLILSFIIIYSLVDDKRLKEIYERENFQVMKGGKK